MIQPLPAATCCKGMGARYIDGVFFNIFARVLIGYLAETIKITRTDALLGVMIAAFVMIFTIPMFGRLSDRIGRPRVYFWGSLVTAFAVVPRVLADDEQRRQRLPDLDRHRHSVRHPLRGGATGRRRRSSATSSTPASATPASPSSTSSPASSPRASRRSSRRRCSSRRRPALADRLVRGVRRRRLGDLGRTHRPCRRPTCGARSDGLRAGGRINRRRSGISHPALPGHEHSLDPAHQQVEQRRRRRRSR